MTNLRRLIEVDLPIGQLSRHARRDKLVRHGHVSTMHYWWARRPLAACRGVELACLLPDPADPDCPRDFITKAAAVLTALRDRVGGPRRHFDDPLVLRASLLQFVADFSDWDRSTDPDFLGAARQLVTRANEVLSNGTVERPLVVDPFAGGGAIPLEALRLGADTFAMDINPVAATLNSFLIELAPRYGVALADELQRRSEWVKARVSSKLSAFYAVADARQIPLAYLWARTVRCEGPGCGVLFPLVRQPQIVRSARNRVGLRFESSSDPSEITVSVVEDGAAASPPTSINGAAVCPCCGYVTTRPRVEEQLRARRGGTNDARLLAVVETKRATTGRSYRSPDELDVRAAAAAGADLANLGADSVPWNTMPLLPAGVLNPTRPSPAARGISPVTRYGMKVWADIFTPRQSRALVEFALAVRDAYPAMLEDGLDPGLARAVTIGLGLGVDRLADRLSSLSRWHATRETLEGAFGRQSLAMVWDFAEGNPLSGSTGDWGGAIDWIEQVIRHVADSHMLPGRAMAGDARAIPLPDDSAACVITDPPYYDQIPYSDLSGLFGEWLVRSLGLLAEPSSGNPEWIERELVVNAGHTVDGRVKDREFFQAGMKDALADMRRVLAPSGIGVVVFAHKETAGWEALIDALINAGWVVTASWPIETEMAERVRARNAASLQSSIHIVCRPREDGSGRLLTDSVGDWRDILSELPGRIGQWMPRLVSEGIVGADAIFACLGPALELFSQHSRVEKASGEPVDLKEFLEHVWAEVARQAMQVVFADATAAGLEEDARLTAMWLWTVRPQERGSDVADSDEDDAGDDQPGDATPTRSSRLVLDFDSARKIAQGLGVRLGDLPTVVSLDGRTATLLSVRERESHLMGAPRLGSRVAEGTRDRRQMTLFQQSEANAAGADEPATPEPGRTVLDRLHQAMILYSRGRSAQLVNFLGRAAAEGDGFWRLAQSLSALYPAASDEKRWVDGVLARRRMATVESRRT